MTDKLAPVPYGKPSFPQHDPLMRVQDWKEQVKEWWENRSLVRFTSPGYRAAWHQQPDEDDASYGLFAAWYEEVPRGPGNSPAAFIRFNWAERAFKLDRFLEVGQIDARAALRDLAINNLNLALLGSRLALDEQLGSNAPTTSLAERDMVFKTYIDPSRMPKDQEKIDFSDAPPAVLDYFQQKGII